MHLDPKKASKTAIKWEEKRLIRRLSSVNQSTLRSELFENPNVVKLDNCRYRELKKWITIYCNFENDKFAVVDSKANELLEFEVGNEINYANIFRYKTFFLERASSNNFLESFNYRKNQFIDTVELQLDDTQNGIVEEGWAKEKSLYDPEMEFLEVYSNKLMIY